MALRLPRLPRERPRRPAFVGNSDGFDFDTEIILKLHAAKKKIVEVPIPTYYGDEICRVNGVAYARDIMIDTLRHRLGRTGFGSGEVGRVTEPYAYKPSAHSSHGRVLQFMQPRPPMRVLDVGCGPGWLAEALVAQGHHVTGVDLAEEPGVRDRMHHFVQADLERGLPERRGRRLRRHPRGRRHRTRPQPAAAAAGDVAPLRPGGTVIASVPNISHWYPRGRTALGLFDYDQRGILDTTHVRFFTRRSFVRMAPAGRPATDRPTPHRPAVRPR